MIVRSLDIAGKLVEFTDRGNILIDCLRLRDWLNDLRECPFCAADLDKPERRYSCSCTGWTEFRLIESNTAALRGTQLQLI